MSTTATKLDDYELLLDINHQLGAAIFTENKKRIMDLYDAAKAIDFDALQAGGHLSILEEYDNLVEKGNEILGV